MLFVWPMCGNMNSVLGLSWNAPIFYSLGAFSGIHIQSLVFRNYKNISWVALGLLITLTITHVLCCPDIMYDDYLMNFFTLAFLVMEVLLMWIAWDIFHFSENNPWYIGLSFFVYAIHRYVIKVVCHVTMLLFGQIRIGDVDEMMTYLVSIPVSLILCVYLAKVWNHISPRSFALVTGGRS